MQNDFGLKSMYLLVVEGQNRRTINLMNVNGY